MFLPDQIYDGVLVLESISNKISRKNGVIRHLTEESLLKGISEFRYESMRVRAQINCPGLSFGWFSVATVVMEDGRDVSLGWCVCSHRGKDFP